jgi:hypothetical protein|eukprot:COSAG06_NODE_6070_length_3127_cov_3.411823_4_plen_53_part_00
MELAKTNNTRGKGAILRTVRVPADALDEAPAPVPAPANIGVKTAEISAIRVS